MHDIVNELAIDLGFYQLQLFKWQFLLQATN